MKLSKLAKRMANDLHIFEYGLTIQYFLYALGNRDPLGNRDIYTMLLEKGYTSEEIKQVFDELICKSVNF